MSQKLPIATLADLNLRDITFVLFRHRRLFFACLVTMTLIGASVAMFWPASYGSTGSVLLKGRLLDRDPSSLETGDVKALPVSQADLYSEVKILGSPALISQALKALETSGNTTATASLGESRKDRLATVMDGLTAAVVPSSNVIDVTFVHSDPDTALALMEALFQSYTQYRQRIYRPERVDAFLSSQVARLKQQMAVKAEQITAQMDRTGLVDADAQVAANLALRREIESTRLRLEEEMVRTTSTQKELERVLDTPRAGVLAVTPVESGVVLHNRAEVAAWLRQIESRQAAIRETLDMLRDEAAKLDQTNGTLRREQMVLGVLQREAGVLEAAHEILLTRQTEAMIDADPGDQKLNPYIAILSSPRLLDGPIFPKPKLVMAVALFAGLLLGLLLAALREVFDPTFSRPVDVTSALGVPVLFSLPKADPLLIHAKQHPPRRDAPKRQPPQTRRATPSGGVTLPGATLAGSVRQWAVGTAIAGLLIGAGWAWASHAGAGDSDGRSMLDLIPTPTDLVSIPLPPRIETGPASLQRADASGG